MQALGFSELVPWIQAKAHNSNRILIGLAGPPACGKSTLARNLCSTLNNIAAGTAAIVGLDGFHYDDLLLAQLGLSQRKGAPETFDVAGYRTLLQRLRANHEEWIAAPLFDRSIEIARAGAVRIRQSVNIVITEGNYLLLNLPEWQEAREHLDATIWLDVLQDTLIERLRQRWHEHGRSPEEAEAWISGNDLPNIIRVQDQSLAGDITFVPD